jgi:hypothetical protein
LTHTQLSDIILLQGQQQWSGHDHTRVEILFVFITCSAVVAYFLFGLGWVFLIAPTTFPSIIKDKLGKLKKFFTKKLLFTGVDRVKRLHHFEWWYWL